MFIRTIVLFSAIFYTTSVIALNLEPTLEDSAISYSEGTSTDYNFTTQEAAADGNLTTKYYKIDIDKNKLSSSSNISWTALDSKPDDMTNVVEVKLPNNQIKYFQYSYTTPSSVTVFFEDKHNSTSSSFIYGGAIENYNTMNNLTGNFISNYASASFEARGGAIFNGNKIDNITGSFIDNHVSSPYAYSGSIFNGGSIGDIAGDFINNYAQATQYSATAGVIENYGTIGNITGDFVGNYATSISKSQGGVIYNYGTMGNITGDFVNNYSHAKSGSSYGGAIYNFGSQKNIGKITGDFVSNHASAYVDAYGGAIYNEFALIENLQGDFIGNYASSNSNSYGGAIYNNNGIIDNVTGDFIGNYISSSSNASGGAIYNYGVGASVGSIVGNFLGNYVNSGYETYGGAIYNDCGSIGDITGYFIDNYVSSISGGDAYGAGGAIYNSNKINNIIGDFIGNYVVVKPFMSSDIEKDAHAYGGAIYNSGDINTIAGIFSKNKITGYGWIVNAHEKTYGGAIYNSGTINSIENSDFNNNYAHSGGAIHNFGTINNIKHSDFSNNKGIGGSGIYNSGIIGDITGNFYNNEGLMGHTGGAGGGAILNNGNIGNIAGDFTDNYIEGGTLVGGAIYNNGTIESITGNFIGNYAKGNWNLSFAYGGAIYNMRTIGYISASFLNNYINSDDVALGGAIYTSHDLNFKTDGNTYFFSGNYTDDYRGRISNAIWVRTSDNTLTQYGRVTINFEIKNGGAFVFDDQIDGGYYGSIYDDNGKYIKSDIIREGYGYNLNISGDVCPNCEVNTVRFNNLVNNIYNLTLDTTQMTLGKSAIMHITHNYIAKNNPYLRLDVDAVNRKVGQINIDGDVEGTTNVIVNVVNYKDIRNEKSIVFVTAKNDTIGDKDSFNIFRVVGSPYMWKINYNSVDKTWGLVMNSNINDYEEDCNPNPELIIKPLGAVEVAPEVVATAAVKTAGLSQTNGMVYNIMRKVGVNRLFCPGCGFYDYNWDGEAFHNAWVDTTYNGLTIEAPVEIDANVWGIEAGSDLQHDLNNKLGIFASYRQGNYEMDGKGEKYYSTIGSEIDIDSYLAGLYYRYDHNNWYAFATVYGGMQEAEIKTDDGVSADTDGIEFGGSVEGGYNYALSRTLSVTPSLGVFYSQINYDDATDSAGKTVEYNDLKQVEIEAGAKFAHTQYTDDGFYSLYVKPSVVQTLVDGDEIDVTELGKVDTIDDKTLGRVEIGGNYGFNDNWSAYGWANYTFGSDYEATSLGAGIGYSW